MKHPPYHLRVNKAVDRAALLEAIRLLADGDPSEYTYYGMGGPFLEDHRLLYATYPQMRLVSIEQNRDTFRRQEFHRPCSAQILDLRFQTFTSFLRTFAPDDAKCIVWADYTGLAYEHFDNFIALLRRVAVGSMIKVTLEANPAQCRKPSERRRFLAAYPRLLTPGVAIPSHDEPFAMMVQGMLQTASELALEGIEDRVFQPVASFRYRDGAPMYTLTGVLCDAEALAPITAKFARWSLANLDWRQPTKIDLPELSAKERQHLQKYLPCPDNAGARLNKRLGYSIDANRQRSVDKLDQWARHHRYAAHFARVET